MFQILQGEPGEVAGFAEDEGFAHFGRQRFQECRKDGLRGGQSPAGAALRRDDPADGGGDAVQRLGLKLGCQVVLLAVGHASLAVDRSALGEAPGVVGDDLVDRFRPEFRGAVERFHEVLFFLREVAGLVVADDADPSEIRDDDEWFHGFQIGLRE